ncbi:urease accessory protein UreE (plasmid) [Enterobacter cloacae]|nr:urease accessory protein UreE [Enterobacter cloacae]
MLLVNNILGHVNDQEFSGRQTDRVWIASADAGRRRLRTCSEGGVDLGIELPRVSWMFDGAVLHDDGMCILVVSRRPELVMVISLNELGPEAVFRIGHALGNRHSPAELHGNELLVPVTDTPDLVARSVQALGLRELTIRFEERPFAAARPPNGVGAAHEHHHPVANSDDA